MQIFVSVWHHSLGTQWFQIIEMSIRNESFCILLITLVIILNVQLTASWNQDEPCRSYPGECKSRSDCPGGTLAKINGQYSCPTSPDGIECCPTGGGGGYAQEEPCHSHPGVCKPSGECPQGSLSKINNQWSCPSSPDGIECCPSGGGYKQDERCRNYPGVCKSRSDCPQGSLARINGLDSCPSSPDEVECCPTVSHSPVTGSGSDIVSAARNKIGLPYIWGGGNQYGPSGGGFDCSGLSQYAVYQATRKNIPRTAETQYNYGGCTSVALGSRQPGDLIFWGNSEEGVYHVAIVSGYNTVVYAPTQGQNVKEGGLYNYGELKSIVRRCW